MSGQLSEGKMITYAIEEMVNVFEGMSTLTDMSQVYDPGAGSLQRSNNQYWKPVQQQAVTKDGWDLTGQRDGVLELSIRGALGDPANTFRELRADDLRDETSYRRAVQADAKKLLSQMEFRAMEVARTQGSFCITDSAEFGSAPGDFLLWDGLSRSTARMIETEFYRDDGTCAFLNPTAYQAGGRDLVRSTANYGQSIPDNAYRNGQIDKKVAGFDDVYQHSKLGLMQGQNEVVTVNGDVSLKPLASEAAPGFQEVPFDNRYGSIPLNGVTANLRIGDKFKLDNGGTPVRAVSLDQKIPLAYSQTFTVVGESAGTAVVSPRPIALNDPNLSPLEASYANIDTQILDGATVTWLNTTDRQSNIIMNKDAMVIASSPIPMNHELFKNLNAREFTVGKINGIIAFDGDINDLSGSYRIALWYAWNMEKPEQCGVLLDGQV